MNVLVWLYQCVYIFIYLSVTKCAYRRIWSLCVCVSLCVSISVNLQCWLFLGFFPIVLCCVQWCHFILNKLCAPYAFWLNICMYIQMYEYVCITYIIFTSFCVLLFLFFALLAVSVFVSAVVVAGIGEYIINLFTEHTLR